MPIRRARPSISAGAEFAPPAAWMKSVDDVVREGTLIDDDRRDAHIQGIHDFYALAAAEGRRVNV